MTPFGLADGQTFINLDAYGMFVDTGGTIRCIGIAPSTPTLNLTDDDATALRRALGPPARKTRDSHDESARAHREQLAKASAPKQPAPIPGDGDTDPRRGIKQ